MALQKSKSKSVAVPVKFYDMERDGVTSGLLGTWLSCQERARLFLEGWTSNQHSFSMTYGTFYHALLERVKEDIRHGTLKKMPSETYINMKLDEIRGIWIAENPLAKETVVADMELALMSIDVVAPQYFRYWFKDDFGRMVWESAEQRFRVPIDVTTPRGVVVSTFLRGMMDGTFRLPDSPRPLARRLFETKTKSRVDEGTLVDILPFERQVNIYMNVLRRTQKFRPAEVLYDVVRRPQLRQGKNESRVQFANRIGNDVGKRPEWYFFRMKMLVSREDMDRFDAELMAMLGAFAGWQRGEIGRFRNSDACETKYGRCPYLKVCADGNYEGLFQRKQVFRELEDTV